MENRSYILLMHLQRMVYKRPFEYLDNLGLMTLAAFLESRGYRARVFTGITTDGLKVFEEEAAAHPIFAVGLYCDYDNQSAVESTSLLLKEKYGTYVIVGGPQTIHLGAEFLKSSKCDTLVRGDGEHTLFELLEWMSSGKGRRTAIQGIVYLDERGEEVSTDERPLISDLDALPWPSASHLLRRPHKYNLSVVSARGCPFRCAFCFEGGNTKTLRLRNVDTVTAEIRQGLRANPDVKYVWFIDDTFTLNYDRTARFCEALASLRLEHDFVWFCEAHAHIINRWPQLIPMMKESGLARMQIGMESGWPPALQLYGKHTTIQEIENVVRLCAEHELPQLHGNFIIGGAGETKDTLDLTASYAEGLLDAAPGLVDISTTFVMPLPNTEIATQPEKFSLSLLDSGSLTSFEDFPVAETEMLTRDEISRARYRFIDRISKKLKRFFKEGKIPRDRIQTHFEMALRYGVASTWYKFLYTRDPFVQPYYTVIVTKSARTLEQIDPAELKDWYPCRVFDLGGILQWRQDAPQVAETPLSPFDYELLWLCSGKTNVREITGRMKKIFRRSHQGSKAEELVKEALRNFENHFWVVFFPP